MSMNDKEFKKSLIAILNVIAFQLAVIMIMIVTK